MTILRSGDVIIRELEIADPEVMRIAIRKEITRSDESRCDRRLHGLPLVTGGHSCRQMPALFREDRRTVQRWVKRFESHGLDGVRKTERSGRDAKQWAGLVPARRMATHNRFFAALSDVLSAVEQYFNRWRHFNSVRCRLCGII